MELNQAISRIKKVSNKFAEEEVRYLQTHREEAIPFLLEIVRYMADNFNVIPKKYEDIDDLRYAIFLLAEFKVHDAFEPFIKLLELDEEKCYWLLGELITEDMASLIASVADSGDIDRLKKVMENAGIAEYQRIAALNALAVMYSEGMYPRAELLEYLGGLLHAYENEMFLLTDIICVCKDVYATEHYGHILDLYKANKVDEAIIGDYEFTEDLPEMTDEEIQSEFKAHSHYPLITDTVKSMKWWACFKEDKPKPVSTKTIKPMPFNIMPVKQKPIPVVTGNKIGRNAPCPCGSGKKYKNCCLNKKI